MADTDYAGAVWTPSGNYWQGRDGLSITHIVAHGTAGLMPNCLYWLTNPQSVASVHYLVDRTGTVHQLVAERDSAWGNGIVEAGSIFLDQPNPNRFTISIEAERDADNAEPLPAVQVTALVSLVADIRRRHGHLPLIPHSAIAPLSRPHCPGAGYPLALIDSGAGANVITWIRFDAKPQRLPLVFYSEATFNHLLYTSSAKATTALHFDGWTRGVPVMDAQTGLLDSRWYHRRNPRGKAGWTPSAWVAGNAEGSTP